MLTEYALLVPLRGRRPWCETSARNGTVTTRKARLHGQLQLNRLGLGRTRRSRGPLAEFVARAHAPNPLLELALVVLRGMYAALIQSEVARDRDRELRRQEVVVVLLDLDVDLERPMAERGRAGLARCARRSVERFFAVADSGEHRHAQHRRVDPRFAEHAERAQALSRWGGAGIGLSNDLLVDARDAEVHREIGLLVELLEDVDVSDDERTFRHDAGRHRIVHERFETASCQLVFAFDRLVGICRSSDRYRALWPASEISAELVGEVGSNFHPPVERFTHISVAIARVVGTRKAIAA